MQSTNRSILRLALGAAIVAAAAISACSAPHRVDVASSSAPDEPATEMPDSAPAALIPPENTLAFERLLDALESDRVIYVGETHDRFDHHLNQLAIIRGLHERGVSLAIGVEFFQEPFQRYLDAYIAGSIGEKTLLKRTEYYDRWRYDFRLYRDILGYARRHKIPVIALNASSEDVSRVSENGRDALSPADRTRLFGLVSEPGRAYRERLRSIFEMHGSLSDERFHRFVDVQLLWDEHMARVAGNFLNQNPTRTMVVLAGSGHLAFEDAIPSRVASIAPGAHSVIVTGPDEGSVGDAVDYVIAERDISLAPPGRFGMMLAIDDEGVAIRAIAPGSPAEATDLRPGDRVVNIAGERIEGLDDVRLAMLDRVPGEEVWIEIQRSDTSRSASHQVRVLTLL